VKKKPLKVGVMEGTEQETKVLWSVGVLDVAFQEAMSFLDKSQYNHLKLQVIDLACTAEPTRSPAVDVRPIDCFYEIRDKGGLLGGINARVFIGIDHRKRSIIVLGAYHKKKNGKTPQAVIIKNRARWNRYMRGDFGDLMGLFRNLE
jgi:hypothetical protein